MINSLGGEQDNVVFMGRRSFRMEIAGGPHSNELAIPMRASAVPTERIFEADRDRTGWATAAAALQPAKLRSSGTSVVALCATTFALGIALTLTLTGRAAPRRAPVAVPAQPAAPGRRTGADADASGDAAHRRPDDADRGAHGGRDPGGVRVGAAAPAARQTGARRRSPAPGSRRAPRARRGRRGRVLDRRRSVRRSDSARQAGAQARGQGLGRSVRRVVLRFERVDAALERDEARLEPCGSGIRACRLRHSCRAQDPRCYLDSSLSTRLSSALRRGSMSACCLPRIRR